MSEEKKKVTTEMLPDALATLQSEKQERDEKTLRDES